MGFESNDEKKRIHDPPLVLLLLSHTCTSNSCVVRGYTMPGHSFLSSDPEILSKRTRAGSSYIFPPLISFPIPRCNRDANADAVLARYEISVSGVVHHLGFMATKGILQRMETGMSNAPLQSSFREGTFGLPFSFLFSPSIQPLYSLERLE